MIDRFAVARPLHTAAVQLCAHVCTELALTRDQVAARVRNGSPMEGAGSHQLCHSCKLHAGPCSYTTCVIC
jgi:hypothetical protein